MGFLSEMLNTFTGGEDARAAQRAGAAQAAAIRRATAIQEQQFNQTRKDLAPFREAGQAAVGTLGRVLNDGNLNEFRTSPGFQFRLDTGVNALDRGAAARGKRFSGAQGRALQQFGQNLGTQDFDNFLNRRFNLAGMGQTATNDTGKFAADHAGSMANLLVMGGNAKASTFFNERKARNNGTQNLLDTGFRIAGMAGGLPT